jgi:hypothetical protein
MKYTPDHTGIAAMLLGPELAAVCARGARLGERWAKANAPVGDPRTDPHAGEFRDSIHVLEDAKSFKGDRVAALLIADSDDAATVEFDNARSDAHRTLTNAIPVIEDLDIL